MKLLKAIHFALMVAAFFWVTPAEAMIRGGEGNKPLPDPGWPVGAAKVFNTESRIAWWEDPPFGGGRWHSECQGDTDAFTELLADVAKIDSVPKRVIVRDGIGRSFWLDPNREKLGNKACDIDWSITVWTSQGWETQKRLPKSFSAIRESTDQSPVLEIHLYIGGLVKWKEVVVPKGIEIVDNTLSAHGYQLTDGVVIEGAAKDKEADKPLVATIELESLDQRNGDAEQNKVVQSITTDSKGNWVIKGLKTGSYQITARCTGYAARRVGYVSVTDEPSWQRLDAVLSKSQIVEGTVVDAESKPIEGVTVWLLNTEYEVPHRLECKTDQNGQFRLTDIPGDSASIGCSKAGYCQIGLPPNIRVPAEKGFKLSLVRAGSILVYVDFSKPKPADYMIHMQDARGEEVGRWGASGSIDADCKIQFDNIPPGNYTLHGRPNPSSDSEKSKTIDVEIVGGKVTEITIEAKD